MDGAHHLPGAGDLHIAWMLLHRKPPPSNRHTGYHDPVVALLLRALLHSDVHQGQLVTFGLEPEVDGVLLLWFIPVVENRVGKPAIAFHAEHDYYLLEHKVEINIELGDMEDD